MGAALARGFKVWGRCGFETGKWVGGIAAIIAAVCVVIGGMYYAVIGIKTALAWSLWALVPLGFVAWLLIVALTGAVSLSNDKSRYYKPPERRRF